MHLIHDLRMSLLVLADGLDSLREQLDTEPLARKADALTRVLEASLVMADELLVSSEVKPPPAPIDVNDVIAGACDVIQEIVGPAVRIDARLERGDCRVYARQIDLDRILLNLVTNAAGAMPSGGVLVIETAHIPAVADAAAGYPDAPFGKLRLTIGDTGHGICPREVWKARDSAQRPRPDGHGVGLSSVSLVLLRLGGSLEIVGSAGAGTVVDVTLPLAPPACERIH